jgi:hypothetical protein
VNPVGAVEDDLWIVGKFYTRVLEAGNNLKTLGFINIV